MAKQQEYKFHPVADAYPLFPDDEAAALAADIAENGLKEDIVLFDGQILDGRNRYRGCLKAGVEPRFTVYDGDTSASGIIAYVRSMNDFRRHLNSSQNAAVARLLSEWLKDQLADEARARQRSAGGDRRSEKAKESLRQRIDEAVEVSDENEGRAAQQLARLHDTNRQYISDVWKFDIEIVHRIRDGSLTIPQAKAELKKTDQASERREQNRKLARPTPESIKGLKNSPGILVGRGWWRPDDEDWMDDLLGWRLQERLDPDGGMIVFRTLGQTKAIVEAVSLLESWEMEVWPHQLDVATGDAAEILVIGTLGKPDVSRLPAKPKRVPCPATGLESLVRSWFMPWAKQQGTVNVIAEVLGDEPHEGFLPFTWKPEPVTC